MIQRGDYFLHAHAARLCRLACPRTCGASGLSPDTRCRAQGCYYRRCDTGNHLEDEFQSLFLAHNSIFTF